MTEVQVQSIWGSTPQEPPIYLNWGQAGADDASRWIGFTFELPFTLWKDDPDSDAKSISLVLETDGGHASVNVRYFPDGFDHDYRDVSIDVDESADKRLRYVTIDLSDVDLTWAFMSLRVRSQGVAVIGLSKKQSHDAINVIAGFREN